MTPAILDPLQRFLDEEEERSALREACGAAAKGPVDMSALLDWVQRYPATATRRAQALTALRAALGLPLIPGPPCRAG